VYLYSDIHPTEDAVPGCIRKLNGQREPGYLWGCLSLDKVNIKQDYTHYASTLSEHRLAHFREKLRAANIVEWKENKSEGASIYFLDPDGHRLEVHSGSLQTRLQACKEKPYEGMIFF